MLFCEGEVSKVVPRWQGPLLPPALPAQLAYGQALLVCTVDTVTEFSATVSRSLDPTLSSSGQVHTATVFSISRKKQGVKS